MLEIAFAVCSMLGATGEEVHAAREDAKFNAAIKAFWDWQYKTANGGGGSGSRIQFAPIYFHPTMQWAVPNSILVGPPWRPCTPFPYGEFPSYSPDPK